MATVSKVHKPSHFEPPLPIFGVFSFASCKHFFWTNCFNVLILLERNFQEKKQPPEMFCRRIFLINSQNSLENTYVGCSTAGVFLWNFWFFFKNTYFEEHLRMTASGSPNSLRYFFSEDLSFFISKRFCYSYTLAVYVKNRQGFLSRAICHSICLSRI